MANLEEQNSGADRSRRIRRLRNLILLTIAAAVMIPICICVILAVRFDRLSTEYERTREDLTWYKEHFGIHVESESESYVSDDNTEDTDNADNIASTEASRELSQEEQDARDGESAVVSEEDVNTPEGKDDGVRRVYLTFDDGPSSSTDEILDILEFYEVKATFFVCGKPGDNYSEMYNRIVNEGHTLGMHSYSHKYEEIYDSLDSFQTDMHKLQTYLYETTGTWTRLYRFPGGSSNTVSNLGMNVFTDYLSKENIVYFDWNVASGDDKDGVTKDVIVSNVLNNVGRFQHSVVLMHDASDKKATVEALPEIIEGVQAMDNTVIVPITEDTLPVQHIINK